MRSPQYVWSLPVRIIHWMIALPVLANFFLEGEDAPHKIVGYIAVSFTLVRLTWGLFAQDHSAFKNFPIKAVQIKTFITSLMNNHPEDHLGHNPLSSFVYLLIWLLVLSLGMTGFMMGLDAFWGEDWLEELHEVLSTAVYALVTLHLVGIIFDSIKHKRKTWMGMIHGKK